MIALGAVTAIHESQDYSQLFLYRLSVATIASVEKSRGWECKFSVLCRKGTILSLKFYPHPIGIKQF